MASTAATKKPPFPANGSEADKLRFLLGYAILAPSGHNTQPWLFRIGDDAVELYADRRRALPVVDPEDRELTISCGAALDHLAVAARYFGRAPVIEPLPDESEPDLLARFRLGDALTPGDEDRALFEAIPERRTTRHAFEDRSLPQPLQERCRQLAREQGAGLTLVADDATKSEIADLVAEGDRTQFADAGFRRELASWVHSRRSESRDGMSGEAFGMPDVLSPVGALVIRTFDIGNGVAAGDAKKIMAGSPLLAILSTPEDDASQWLHAGRALSRVLLRLAADGATAAYLNQPLETPQLRPLLQDVMGSDHAPQLLLRFGYGPKVKASARRPLNEVLI
jgi:hypothetical protein